MAFNEAGGRQRRLEDSRRAGEISAEFTRRRVTNWLKEVGLIADPSVELLTDLTFPGVVEAAYKRIVDARMRRSDLILASRLLQKASIHTINRLNLKADPFIALVENRRSSSFRNEKWFHSLKYIEEWEVKFIEVLKDSRRQPSSDREFWIGLLIWSAMARGFCLEGAILDALVHKIFLDPKPLERGFGERLVVILEVQVEKGDCNVSRGDNFFRRVIWPPDAMSLALINRALIAKPNAVSPSSAFELVARTLWGSKAEAARRGFNSIGRLAQAALWLAENRPRVRAPQTLVSIAVGEQSSQSLDDIGLATIRQKQLALSKAEREPIEEGRDLEEPLTSQMAQFFEKLEPIIRVVDDAGKAVHNKTIRVQLDAVAELFPVTTMERLLIEWFKSLLDRGLKVGTVVSYKSLVSRRLLEEVSGLDMTSFTATDFLELYEVVLEQDNDARQRERRAGRLQDFHDFLVNKSWVKAKLDERLQEGATSIRRVRARHIPFEAYWAIRKRIRSEFGAGALSDSLELGVILAWRAGLRVGEVTKLRHCDIEMSAQRTLFVRVTAFGSNKSPAAKRHIDLAALLSPPERSILERVLLNSGKSEEARRLPLLRPPQSRRPFNKSKYSAMVSNIMKKILNGKDWTFHHLRHSAFNNIFLVLENLSADTSPFHGWSVEQQKQVRLSVVGDGSSRQKTYFALAAFAGHASPTETFGSYIHLAREVMSEHVAKMNIYSEQTLYAAAIGTDKKSIAAIATDGELRNFLAQRLRQRSLRRNETDFIFEYSEETETPLRDTCSTAFEVLSRVQGGASLLEANQIRVAPSTVELWIARAHDIANQKSRKGVERHLTQQRLGRFDREGTSARLILPAELKREADLRDANKLIDAFSKYRGLEPAAADRVVRYGLDHLVQAKSGLRFRNLEDLELILQAFAPTRDLREHWYLEICLADPQLIPHWRALFPDSVRHEETLLKIHASKRKGWAKGYVILHLQASDWQDRGQHAPKHPRSSRALKYVLHMLGIVAADEEAKSPPPEPGDLSAKALEAPPKYTQGSLL